MYSNGSVADLVLQKKSSFMDRFISNTVSCNVNVRKNFLKKCFKHLTGFSITAKVWAVVLTISFRE